MRKIVLLALTLAACSRPSDTELTAAAIELSGMTFDTDAPIATSGHVAGAVWPEGGVGLIVVQTGDGMKYAFSTAGVPAMAKQGFTRTTMGPGEEVGVSGLLAPGKTVAGGLIAARADAITKGDGTRVFTRQ